MTRARKTLLLLVDLQKSFCDDDGSMARQGRNVGMLKAAALHCDELATLARSGGIPVVWTRMVFRPDYSDGGETIRLRPNLRQVGALRSGSGDEVLSSLVHTEPGEVVLDKPRFSAMYGTPLEVVLRAGKFERVIVGGVTTSMCVESTVRDLGQRDYETVVVDEACADFDAARHRVSLEAMAFGFARIASLAEAADLLGGGSHG